MSEESTSFIIGLLLGILVSLGLAIPLSYHKGQRDLARQIAERTHEVQHTRNDFGTLEYRIVEIKEGE